MLYTHKEVVGIGNVAADSEQFHQIVELTVNVTAYLERIVRLDEIRRVFCPWLSTVTGAVTVTTFPSSIKSSLALWQSSRTCASGIGRQARS